MDNLYENILDQEVLKKIESLCIQEEPPECNAICPMHVDIKSVIKKIQENNEAEAYKIYTKTIPFPKIISYTCNAPCENRCKRNDIGGAIKIGELEKYIVGNNYVDYKKPLFMSKKNEKVAIIGGGLRGIMAAFDLLIKGFKVTIYEREDSLGGKLNTSLEDNLSKKDLEDDIKKLFDLSVEVKYTSEIKCDTIDDVEEFMEENKADVVYISCRESDLFGKNDKETQLVDEERNIFSGSRTDIEGSTIYEIYDGKSASMSIDRKLKKVSILAGREKEGSFETKLYTNTEYYDNESAVKKTEKTYIKDQAIEEANRCIQCECLECIKGCSFMEHYKLYPKKYIREVYNNLSIAMGVHTANKMINTCNVCGQCKEICPNNLDLGEFFLAARKIMVRTKKMPPSAHEFALLDMEYSNGEDFFLTKHQQGHVESAFAYFPSCQLAASEPDLTMEVYDDLCNKLEGGVGIFLSCCSIMANWAGEEDIFKENIEKLKQAWVDLGSPKVITSCPMCLKTLKEHAGIDTIGVWKIFKDYNFEFPIFEKNMELTAYDSCAARYDKDTQENIRNLASEVGVNVSNMKYSLDNAPCCGYGGLTPFVDREVANSITKGLSDMSEKSYLTYCVNCRDRLIDQGKESYHILEMLYNTESVRRKPPTWSLRQENRKYLKRELISKYWQDEELEADLDCKLYIDDELEKVIDNRMILYSDIQKAILHSEETGECFKDPKTGRKTSSYIPRNVTFWVEYSKEDKGYRVHNAYSHRMVFRVLNE